MNVLYTCSINGISHCTYSPVSMLSSMSVSVLKFIIVVLPPHTVSCISKNNQTRNHTADVAILRMGWSLQLTTRQYSAKDGTK